MKLDEYIKVRGRQAQLARQLGVSPVLIHQWANERPIPVQRCLAIELATEGQVTRKELRPNDWHAIWPDLSASGRSPGRREGDGISGRRKLTGASK